MEKTIFRDYLTIDAETRKISIPSRIKNLGVESDADVKRLYFKIQKQYGEMDFTKADIRINFANANGEGDYYPVADKQVEGGTVTFSWLVGRNATEYKGDVCFIVCAKISDIEGIVKKEFNTTLASLPVLEGKETTQQIVQQYPDVIEQILKKLEGATTITPEQIQAAVDAYLEKNPITFKETDPTVPEWAKQPQKPAYTASEVDAEEKGAVADHNSDAQAHLDIRRMIEELPGGSGTTDYNSLENKPQINGRELVGNKTLEELGLQIPAKLPNPHILTFTGAVAETYDGSKEVTIDIPSGGGGSGTTNYVTPEEFGAKGDGRTDDSTAFKNALLTGKKVMCMPKKVYNFTEPVDVRTLYEGHLDLNGSLLKNFHVLVNLNDAGNDWRQTYPVGKFVIENGEIGGIWGERPTDWEVPVIKTGTQMRLQHLKFTNSPYMLAMVNQYLDYMTFEDCLYVENHALFQGNVLKLDAVNVIGADGNAKRIDGTAQNLAGDAWIFKQCNEWYSPNNKDYKMVAFHNNSNATMINCVQSGFRLGGSFSDYARVTCISCHWEEAGSMPVLGGDGSTLYLCSALFLGCFFWGNYKLFNFKNVQYINCLFTQTIDNYRLPHIDFAEFTGGKYLHELDCVLQNCGVGGNYIIDTNNIKQTRKSPKKTYNKFMDYLNISNLSTKVMESWEHAKFNQTGQYTYEMYVLATELDNYSYSFKTQQINITNERTQVTALLGNAIGGFGIRAIRTSPNGEMHETILHSSSEIAIGDDGNPVARNLVFHDYGEWCDFGFNDDIKTQLPNIWKKISKKPNMIKNVQMLEANGVLITKDNSKIENLNGMVQVTV